MCMWVVGMWAAAWVLLRWQGRVLRGGGDRGVCVRRPGRWTGGGVEGLVEALELVGGGAGGAVAGQVGEQPPRAQAEGVGLPGSAGRVGGPRERLAAGQCVDQAGLADVGAAGEGDLGQFGLGQVGFRTHAHDEVAFPGKQYAAPFEGRRGLGVVFGVGGFLNHLPRTIYLGLMATPMRFMMIHCWVTESRLFQVQ